MAQKSKKTNRGAHASRAQVSDFGGEAAAPLRKKRRVPWPVRILIFLLVVILAAGGVGAYIASGWLQDLPEINAEDFETASPTRVYANDRTTLLAEFKLQNRYPISSLSEAGSYVAAATVATEDERFYEHGGIDLAGIARALVNNIQGGEIEGASTITQQLVRNTVLADEATDMTLKRKLREAVLAEQVEQNYSKDEILLMYLNTINYGSGAYGIEAAAQRYYSKSASELTLNEAATLVGIPQSPTYNNPIDYPDHALDRRNVVLDRMVSNGYITEAQAAAAKAEPITLNPSEFSNDGIIQYPYFSSYVRQCLMEELSYDQVFSGGLTVYTTLDITAQEAAEAAAEAKANEAGSAFECALTAIDPDNGYVKAMVGGRDYYENQYNLAAQAARQTGSSFKTFTLVTALKQGISPQTYVNCSSSVKIGDWEVHNYNYQSYGTTTIANAFAVSSNTGFARLVTAVSPAAVVQTAYDMGITTTLNAVPSITLGTQDCSTLDMADAYATIANGGTHYDAVVIEQALDNKGNVVIDNTDPTGKRAISAEVAHAAVEVMKGVITSGTGTKAKLSSGQEAAGKTGTTEDNLDSWFCGITPQYSVAIWLGDRMNEKATTVTAASCFATFLNQLITSSNIEKFPEAKDPEYTKKFNNADLDIDNLTNTSNDEDADTSSNKNTNAANNANTNANANSSESGEGSASNENTNGSGGESGGESGGGSGGESGGDSGGGSGGESGGDSGGGDSGGESGSSEGDTPTPVAAAA